MGYLGIDWRTVFKSDLKIIRCERHWVAIALPSINTAPGSITILAISLKIINNSKKLFVSIMRHQQNGELNKFHERGSK